MVLESTKLKATVLNALKILWVEEQERALSTGGQLPNCLSGKEEKDTWVEGFTGFSTGLCVYCCGRLFV